MPMATLGAPSILAESLFLFLSFDFDFIFAIEFEFEIVFSGRFAAAVFALRSVCSVMVITMK